MRGKKIDVAAHIDKLVEAVRVGACYEVAAQYAGISKDTFDRWRKQMEAAQDGTPLAELRTRLREAEGRAGLSWLALINRAATEDWKAASWLLAKRYPEAYGPGVTKVAPVGAQGEPLPLQVIYLPSKSPTPEQWQEDVKDLGGYSPNGHGDTHRT